MSDDDPTPLFEASREHEFLARQAGEWHVRCSYSMGPDIEPMEVEGSETTEMLGPFWLIGRFEADLLGSPMVGQAATGYDPVRKRFIGTWKDSSIPFLYTFEGFLDDERKTLRLSGENYDPMRGVRAIYRSVIEYLSDKERRLSLSVEIAGGDVSQILEYHYTRK